MTEQAEKFYKTWAGTVRILEPKDGATIVLRTETVLPAQDSKDALQALARQFPGRLVLLLGSGQRIQTLDDESMRKAGWIRAPKPSEGPGNI